MIGKTVQFTTTDGHSIQEREGFIIDKVRVANNNSRMVCAIDQYVIEESLSKRVFLVFPAYVIRVNE